MATKAKTRKASHPKPPQASVTPEDVGVQAEHTGRSAAPGFPIVGIGASAGGLAAFESFFSGMPAGNDPEMAFVLVQHLAPDHKSLLSALIQRFTRMKVFEVEDGMVVQSGCAYIIPPNRDMALVEGTLQLFEPKAPRGHAVAIDFFFRSLATDQQDRSIGIILSGTGTDGSLGARAIHGAGGMVMAQLPDSAEFDGMPRSAIATGIVDYELPPAEMPAQLIAYSTQGPGTIHRPDAKSSGHDFDMNKVFALLRTETGHDFSRYKRNMVDRRVERRMAVNQVESFEQYARYLQRNPEEVTALFRDMLIGVTSFFRDPETYQALESLALGKLLTSKPPGATVRVWSVGCSTGEEAYSLAILLQEQLEMLLLDVKVQVFATDIDSEAITAARTGLFPASITTDVSPARLARFFSVEPDGTGYRIKDRIRDMLIFSEQDVIKDPPFSRLDLISCRNLMIYMGTDLQQGLFSVFHYTLNPHGTLFLGTSETVGDATDLFEVVDRKSKLYRRREGAFVVPRADRSRFRLPTMPVDPSVPRAMRKTASVQVPPLRELTEQALLRLLAPVGALVNREGDVLYLHGRTGMYLEPAPGAAGIPSVLNMAREGSRSALSAALRKAAQTDQSARWTGLRVKTNGAFTEVDLTVTPVATGSEDTAPSRLYLVVWTPAAPADVGKEPTPTVPMHAEGDDEDPNMDAAARILALKRELSAKDEHVRAHTEELEIFNEELKSSNEEMQSVNEELQSTNEELETSKEELQSVNEELATVNAELQAKLSEVSLANNDMNNLLAGTGVGTIFLSSDFSILRFTPAASSIVNLIPGDVGRPLGHIASNLVGYDSLEADARAVLDTLVTKEVEVHAADGDWYILRILPYRTLDNVIAGVVVTFSCITEIVRARQKQHEADSVLRLTAIARDANDAITTQGMDGRIWAWNPAASRLYGWSEQEALAMNVRDRIPEDLREEALATVEQLLDSEELKPYRTQRLTSAGDVVDVWMTCTALVNERGQTYAIATTERPIVPTVVRSAETADGPVG